MDADLEYHLIVVVPGYEPASQRYGTEVEARIAFHQLYYRLSEQIEELKRFHLRILERGAGGGRLILEAAPYGRSDFVRRPGQRRGSDLLQRFFS